MRDQVLPLLLSEFEVTVVLRIAGAGCDFFGARVAGALLILNLGLRMQQ